MKNKTSVMAVVVCNNKVLTVVVKINGKPTLTLPYGQLELETEIHGAMRDCYNKTDVVLDCKDAVRELPSYSYITKSNGYEIRKTIVPILFRLPMQPCPRAKEIGIIEAKFMPIDEFLQKCPYDNVKKIFEYL